MATRVAQGGFALDDERWNTFAEPQRFYVAQYSTPTVKNQS